VNKKILIALMLSLSASAAQGFEMRSIDVGMAFAWRFNAKLDSTPRGKQPSIVLLSPGVAVNASFDDAPGGLFFRPGAWLTWIPEEIYEGVARSSSHERAGYMKVFGFISELHFGYEFKVKKFDIGIQGGPTVHIRIPAWTGKNSSVKRVDFWRAYYGEAQFIHFGISSWILFPISEGKDIIFGITHMLPISNLWSGTPFAHGMQIALMGALRFSLK